MRLIDADAWEEYFYEHMDDLHMEAAKNALDEMPTIDAVEVVRCKDCINRGTEECAMEYETEDGEYIWNEDQDFCSWGEREEDGGR